MSNIYITSDLHLCHDQKFIYEKRGFPSIEAHDLTIVENWNQMIEEDDDVYVLGDLVMNNQEKGLAYLKQLKGKLHVLIGNHDTPGKIEKYQSSENVVELCGYSTVLTFHKYHFYLSHYPTLTTNMDYEKPLKARLLNLCGHTHQKEKWDHTVPLSYHVELDAHDLRPVLLEDIIQDFKEKSQEEKD